jgi:indolepyruvate ferredoxin oxidoreductase beta subunit
MTKNMRLQKDPFNIIITGVGGQGNVMASRVVGNMLSDKGFKITIGETFGASQRGGSVMSHIRVSGQGTWSPQIPKGQADLIVALEPSEAVRVLKDYGHPGVIVLANTRPVYPIGVIAGDVSYPGIDELREGIRLIAPKAFFIHATDEALWLGNAILSNIVMVGAVVGLNVLPFDKADFKKVIGKMVSKQHLAINLKAFERGLQLVPSGTREA